MTPAKTVFLSHNSRDKPFVRRLSSFLSSAGFRCWIDESEIRFGDSLIAKISEAIEAIDFVVAVISRNSVDSSWVRQELDWAMTREINDRRVVVIPVVIDRCDVPFFLRNKLYADFTDPGSFDDVATRLAESLQRHTGNPLPGGGQETARPFGATVLPRPRPTWLAAAIPGMLITTAVGAIIACRSFARTGVMETEETAEFVAHADAFFMLVVALCCMDIMRVLLLRYAMRSDAALADDVGSGSIANLFSRRYRRIVWRNRKNRLFMTAVVFEGVVLCMLPVLIGLGVRIARHL